MSKRFASQRLCIRAHAVKKSTRTLEQGAWLPERDHSSLTAHREGSSVLRVISKSIPMGAQPALTDYSLQLYSINVEIQHKLEP